MEPNSIEEFEARHAACTDDPNPEIASEVVFSIALGQLSLDVWGLGEWPNCTLDKRLTLTKEATAKLIQYLTRANIT